MVAEGNRGSIVTQTRMEVSPSNLESRSQLTRRAGDNELDKDSHLDGHHVAQGGGNNEDRCVKYSLHQPERGASNVGEDFVPPTFVGVIESGSGANDAKGSRCLLSVLTSVDV